jgi:hypothetical protein
MKETIAQIRTLLNNLESGTPDLVEAAAIRAFSGLELPDIMKDVVDLLVPELRPFEAAIYFYLLRHSIIETGTQYIRASRRGLQSGVVKSAYTGSTSGGKMKKAPRPVSRRSGLQWKHWNQSVQFAWKATQIETARCIV